MAIPDLKQFGKNLTKEELVQVEEAIEDEEWYEESWTDGIYYPLTMYVIGIGTGIMLILTIQLYN